MISDSDRAFIGDWLNERRITEIECVVPDQAGIARGKILPTKKFLDSLAESTLRLPESVFAQTVTGDFITSRVLDPVEPDIILIPDKATLCPVPWHEEPTAMVICDACYTDGTEVEVNPRAMLKRVLSAYSDRGWSPVVAPELEFYLVKKNIDPDYPLEPPSGTSGRPEFGSQSYGIDAVNEFDPIFEDIYDYCEAQNIDIDTLIHEAGLAQVEINFNHGDPLILADQVMLFKRTVRQTALSHGVYATFMAKPHQNEPGSAMHIHQNVMDMETKRNLFAADDNTDSALFLSHIAGLQRYMPDAMPLFAPTVNSYRRLVRYMSAPVNTHWGYENRTVGFRIPAAMSAPSRRVENRVAGADANPYLALAASLGCGYLGMIEGLEPTAPMTKSAYESKDYSLPTHLLDALVRFRGSMPLRDLFGERFHTLYLEVKEAEHAAYQEVISAWERAHLLLNV